MCKRARVQRITLPLPQLTKARKLNRVLYAHRTHWKNTWVKPWKLLYGFFKNCVLIGPRLLLITLRAIWRIIPKPKLPRFAHTRVLETIVTNRAVRAVWLPLTRTSLKTSIALNTLKQTQFYQRVGPTGSEIIKYATLLGCLLAGYLHWRPAIYKDRKHWLAHLVEKADLAFRNMLKWQMHTNLFSNPIMDDITARSLVTLVHMDDIQKLMTDLFLLIYRQKPIQTVIEDFTRDQIADYLVSAHCLKAFSFIVTQHALGNSFVLDGLYVTLCSYLRQDSENIDNLLGQVLINVGWSDMVRAVMDSSIKNQC